MTTKTKKETSVEARRGFLRMASVGAVATGVATIAGAPKQADAAAVRQDGSLGYQETDHVKKNYELARF